MPFCGMCAASAIECPRAWSPSSHTSQKTRCMRHPRLSVAARGGAYMPFCGMCATSGYRMPACLEPLIAHIDALHPSSTIVRRIGRRPGVPHVGLLSNGAELKNQPKRELNLAGGAGGLVDDPEA